MAAPPLLALNAPPSATFLNQATAFIGWAAALLLLVPAIDPAGRRRDPGALALLAALAACALAGVGSMAWAGLPPPLGGSLVGAVAAAGLVVAFGMGLSDKAAPAAFRALCTGLVVAGMLSVAVGLVQAFVPQLADGVLVAVSAFEGRASGNLRQPNHLSTLLLWALVAVAWLHEAGHARRAATVALTAALTFTLVLTASRTGILGTVVLAAWGLADRRLSRTTRALLIASPLVYWLFWMGLSAWAHGHQTQFAGEARITAEGDISSSRFAIWRDTLHLVAAHPWTGVGFGEFNFAWSLTPFPQRPVAFFDHTHNLPLQLLVELGVPLGTAVFGLLLYALWRAFAATRAADGAQGTLLRAAFMLVLVVGLHSLLEYPLWYAYFLLPAAFAFGIALRGAPAADPAPAARRGASRPSAWRLPALVAAAVMLGLSLASVADYQRVVAIFSSDDAVPLERRIAEGERSWFFAHHAHYAAATIAERPSEAMASFRIATHYLLDTRLMMAWATALAEAGDVERARHLAARLREFRNEDSKPFFAPCDEPSRAEPLPFQCTPPSRAFDYRDFR